MPAHPTNDADCHTLLGQLKMADSGMQQQAIPKTHSQWEQIKAVRKTEDGRQQQKTEVTWCMPHEELNNRYINQQPTLLPILSAAESPVKSSLARP